MLACVVIAVLIFNLYGAVDASLLPLDDAYIHLNYARSIAVGQPYRYNPDDPPTSGATSFLYPYLLAPAVLIAGERPLNAALWAMQLGAVAFAAAGALVGALGRALGAREGWGVTMLAFMFTGLFAWHAMSGMETMLITAASLLALYAVAIRSIRLGALGGTLCALLRPEGAILALLTVAALYIAAINLTPPTGGVRLIPRRYQLRRELLLLLVPIAAIGIQPLVNWIMTGSPGSTGGSAKSLLGMVPFDAGIVAVRVIENFIRVWRDLLLGNAPDHVIGALFVLAIVGWIALLRRDRLTAITIALWAVVLSGAIATLDTAFWHFRRYQIPLIAVVYPLAAVGLSLILTRLFSRPRARALVRTLTRVGLAIGTLIGALTFLSHYLVNLVAIGEQPYPLALDLAAYPDRDARVAVHDVGLMRYIGGLHTIDMVGLTTPGAAAWWRQGPGAVGEYLDSTRPDLIASYGEGHGVGLGYLADTDLYAETLSEYTSVLDEYNVALAAPTQGLYRPNYATADNAARTVLQDYMSVLDGASLVDYLDVANLESERAHNYQWWNNGFLPGFATEWHQFPLAGCIVDDCVSMDGGRRLTGGEIFTLDTLLGQDLLLITRVHASAARAIWVEFLWEGQWEIADSSRLITAQRGQWVDIPTFRYRDLVGETMQVRVRLANDSIVYEPYAHFVYQHGVPVDFSGLGLPVSDEVDVTFIPGYLYLMRDRVIADGNLTVTLNWWAGFNVTGDVKRFAHLSDADDEIVAQVDGYIAKGALTVGNLPPGSTRDPIQFDVTGVQPGTYTVYVGLYDANTLERLPADGDAVDRDNRVRIGTITIEEPSS